MIIQLPAIVKLTKDSEFLVACSIELITQGYLVEWQDTLFTDSI